MKLDILEIFEMSQLNPRTVSPFIQVFQTFTRWLSDDQKH